MALVTTKVSLVYFPDIVRELATHIHKGKGVILVELTFEACQIHGPAMIKSVQDNSRGLLFVAARGKKTRTPST